MMEEEDLGSRGDSSEEEEEIVGRRGVRRRALHSLGSESSDGGDQPSSDTGDRRLSNRFDSPDYDPVLDSCSNSSYSPSVVMGGDDDEVPVLQKPKPKHKWFVIKELMKRELYGGNMFKDKYYGSLHVVQRLELMYKMEEHSGCVNAINFNPSGTRLISGSDDRCVAVWDWALGKSLAKFFTGHSSNVFQCKYLGGDYHIATCSRDGQVRLATCTGSTYETKQVALHNQPCHKLTTVAHSQTEFLTAGEDALIMSVDIRQPKPTKLMYVKEDQKKISLYSIFANPQTGLDFVVAGEDHYIRIYDRRRLSKDGAAHFKYSPHNVDSSSLYYVTCAVFNYNGSEVIGSYNDDDVYLFNTKQAPASDFAHKYEGHRNSQTVKGVTFFGPKSEYIVSGSDCGNIYIWDKETEAIVQFMRGDADGVINCLEPHPHVPILATSGLDSDVKIWIPSCEHDPPMKGLKRTLKMNKSNREMRFDNHTSSLNETLLRLWNQISRNNYVRRVMVPRESVSRPPLNGSLFSNTSSSSDSSSSTSDNENNFQL